MKVRLDVVDINGDRHTLHAERDDVSFMDQRTHGQLHQFSVTDKFLEDGRTKVMLCSANLIMATMRAPQ